MSTKETEIFQSKYKLKNKQNFRGMPIRVACVVTQKDGTQGFVKSRWHR